MSLLTTRPNIHFLEYSAQIIIYILIQFWIFGPIVFQRGHPSVSSLSFHSIRQGTLDTLLGHEARVLRRASSPQVSVANDRMWQKNINLYHSNFNIYVPSHKEFDCCFLCFSISCFRMKTWTEVETSDLMFCLAYEPHKSCEVRVKLPCCRRVSVWASSSLYSCAFLDFTDRRQVLNFSDRGSRIRGSTSWEAERMCGNEKGLLFLLPSEIKKSLLLSRH